MSRITEVRKRYATQLKTLDDRKATLRKQINLINDQISAIKKRRTTEIENIRRIVKK